MIARLAAPAHTANTLRDLTRQLRAAGHTTITVDQLDNALNLLEANGWELPKEPPCTNRTLPPTGSSSIGMSIATTSTASADSPTSTTATPTTTTTVSAPSNTTTTSTSAPTATASTTPAHTPPRSVSAGTTCRGVTTEPDANRNRGRT